MGLGPYMTRFNGLNYLSHPYLGSNSTSYTDWSREHTPGGGYHHQAHTDHGPCPRRYPGHRTRKSSSKTPDTTLASSSKHSSKRDSSELVYSSGASHAHHKKSSLKNSGSSQHQMLLNPNGLPSNHNQSHYDESSRVYHITP